MRERRTSRTRSVASLLYGTALLGLTSACGSREIFLATIPGSDAGDSGDVGEDVEAAPGPLCGGDASDCEPGFFCSKLTCTALMGTCEPLPTQCPNDEAPVCGCPDFVTYFNDCLRRKWGVASSFQGSIQGGCPPLPENFCDPSQGMQCPIGSSCAHLLAIPIGRQQCAAFGACWRLPDQCPASPKTFWDGCGSDMRQCIGTCKAVQEGGTYQIVQSGERCP